MISGTESRGCWISEAGHLGNYSVSAGEGPQQIGRSPAEKVMLSESGHPLSFLLLQSMTRNLTLGFVIVHWRGYTNNLLCPHALFAVWFETNRGIMNSKFYLFSFFETTTNKRRAWIWANLSKNCFWFKNFMEIILRYINELWNVSFVEFSNCCLDFCKFRKS